MSVSNDYLIYVQDQFRELGPVTTRKMFGGAGVYYRGLFFAIVSDDTLFLKVDDSNRADFEQAGMKPFVPFDDKPNQTMPYYEVPEEVFESPPDLAIWARKSVAVAEKASKNKKKKTPKM